MGGFPLSLSAGGKGLHSVPRGRQPGADGMEQRGGGALGAQSWGAAGRAPPASPAHKPQRTRVYERSLKTGSEGSAAFTYEYILCRLFIFC